MKHDFTKARLKLVLLYLLIIGVVIVLFALLIIHQANDSFSDPSIQTSDEVSIRASDAMNIAQKRYPHKNVTGTEYEIENQALYFTTVFEDQTEVKVNLLTGETYVPEETARMISHLFDDFEEMVVWIGLSVFLLAGTLCVYIANKTLAPIVKNMQQQKQFVSDAAHELRNPLSALHARIESVLSTYKTVVEKEVLTDLLSETKRLIAISEHLLSLEKAELPQTEACKQSMQDSVTAVISQLQHNAQEKGVSLRSDIEEGKLRITASDLETILYNLLHNAIKFTPQGGTVTVHYRQKILIISDTGIGMEASHIPYIFDRFYKADMSRTHEGNGLGLSLVKTLLEKYGATIAVTSRDNTGSTFTITFKK